MVKYCNMQTNSKECKCCTLLLNKENTYASDWKAGYLMCKKCRYAECRKNITSEKQSKYSLTRRLKIKFNVFEKYGIECKCCSENIFDFLTIDHIGNTGAAHRKETGLGGGTAMYSWLIKNNFQEDKFRTLCFNCNCCIGFFGFCQHDVQKSENCYFCKVILTEKNMFQFHKKGNISICQDCVINKSIKRNDKSKDNVINGQTLYSRRKTAKKHLFNIKLKVIEKYGSKCNCCGESNYMLLTIDHINNDGACERSNPKFNQIKLYKNIANGNFYNDYQLLCYNCNHSKFNMQTCYHKICKNINKEKLSFDEYKDIILRKTRLINIKRKINYQLKAKLNISTV